MKIIFTRHCETDWNKEQRVQGQTDISLNDAGRIQAAKLAHDLGEYSPSIIISSDLSRALETAHIISAHFFGPPIIADKRLQECSFGKLEGKTTAELVELYSEETARLVREEYRSYDFGPFGGESRSDVFARHFSLFETVKKRDDHGTILVVGHGKGLNTLLAGLGFMPNLSRGTFRVLEV